MNNWILEAAAKDFLNKTPQREEVAQLEKMTWFSRKIITHLDKFNRPHQSSPDAASIMKHLMDETWVTDKNIILSSIINILENGRNDAVVWKNWIEKKDLVTTKIYNYCVILKEWYEDLVKEITSTQENVSKVFDDKQLEIKFPEE